MGTVTLSIMITKTTILSIPIKNATLSMMHLNDECFMQNVTILTIMLGVNILNVIMVCVMASFVFKERV